MTINQCGKCILVSILVLFTTVSFNKTLYDDIIQTEEQVTKILDPKQLICMATNIFYEAGRESTDGKAAVARVTLNRVNNGFGKTPCQVVYQTATKDDQKVCQFSWVCEGKGNPNKRDPSYQDSLQVAYDVLILDKYKDVIPKNTLFFHNKSVQPDWNYYEKVQVIGNHIFYSKKKKSKKHDRRHRIRGDTELPQGA
jgi:spore germination cell wall hydrolase CwlJ-like protein